MEMIRGLLFLLLVGASVHTIVAQTSIEKWRKKYDPYSSDDPKVHLVFNQDKFSPGDTAFFKVYILSNSLKSIAGSRMLDFYFVDSKATQISHHIFRIKDGLGFGQFVVPTYISAGLYTMVARLYGHNSTASPGTFFKVFPIVTKNIIVPNERPYKVSVEGGNLIPDTRSEILISTSPDTDIALIDGSGSLLKKSKTDHSGFCRFSFFAKRDVGYFVKIQDENINRPLPAVLVDGINLRLSFRLNKPNSVWAKTLRNSQFRQQKLWMTLTVRQQLVQIEEFSLDQDSVELIIQPKLPLGVARISILDRNSNVVAYRNFFSPGEESVIAEIDLQTKQYRPREKVTGFVKITDPSGKPLQSEYAMSVTNTAIIGNVKDIMPTDFYPQIPLSDDEFYIQEFSAGDPSLADNIVLSRTSPDPWKQTERTNQNTRNATPKNNLYKIGTISLFENRKLSNSISAIFFYLQKSRKMYKVTIDDGKVLLLAADFFDDEELLYIGEVDSDLTSSTDQIPKFGIEWAEEVNTWFQLPSVTEIPSPDPYSSFKLNKNVIDKSFNSFDILNKLPEKGDLEYNIGSAPDIMINLSNYNSFPDMEGLIKEVVPSLQHRKLRQGTVVRVSLPAPMNATGDPIYIIDGIATNDTNFFLALKPVDLASIAIINHPKKLLPLGRLGSNGVVVVNSKKGGIREPVDPNKKFKGITRPIAFRPIDGNANEKAKPDFRSTIFWSPLNKTNLSEKTKFEFVTSDDLGEMTIKVQGVTNSGIPFSTTAKFKVTLTGNQQ
ncbi:MAG: hypothetical protein ING84_07925 [Cytophagales bacterium]|nr:hypothetical protein [Cytophagales bacterium]